MQKSQEESEERVKKSPGSEREETKERFNQDKLILDATCAPGDISYPNDLVLLNQARIKI